MLSKTKYAQLGAVAALAIMLGTGASLTSAQAQSGQNPQMEKQQSGSETRSGGEKTRDAGSARETSRNSGATREMRSDRTRDRSSTQTTVRRDRDNDRSRVTVRDRDRHHDWRWRGRTSYGATTFVVLGSRHHYRPGWCRGLHRGHHFAPGAGEHVGKHVGLFRC